MPGHASEGEGEQEKADQASGQIAGLGTFVFPLRRQTTFVWKAMVKTCTDGGQVIFGMA
jgi:hypothetical protein